MKHRIGNILGVIVLGLLVGCAGGHGRDINDAKNSLVFGYIDMDEAPTSVSYAWIKQVAPPIDKPYWGTDVRNGLFYTAYLPPGSFQLSHFGGSSFFRGQHQYNVGRQGNETSVSIKKPGIYFIGAYKYKKLNTGFFAPGKFSVERTNSPTEAELLRRILENDREVRDSAWGSKIRARLARLKK